ncbi:MAG: hypothetical protein GOV15_02775, partial [Candidatus Diapherotrites archaeon]|nr:hypothetical protein [Candidatus Diapherotrites archaeon]
MNYDQHKLVGRITLAIVTLAYLFLYQTKIAEPGFIITTVILFALMLLVTELFSVLPDIDMRKTRIRKQVTHATAKTSGLVAGLFTLIHTYNGQLEVVNVFNALLAGLFTTVAAFIVIKNFKVQHRGFTHTIRFGALASSVVFAISFLLTETIQQAIGATALPLHPVLISLFIAAQAFISHASHLILD